MKRFLLVFITFLFGNSFAQENLFSTESFIIKLTGRNMEVENLDREIVLQKSFSNPKGYVADLNNDGNVEFFINDCSIENGKRFYNTYIYNTLDTFYVMDSIYSGLKEPYYTFSNELNEVILITGSPDFDSLNSTGIERIFSPLICWGFSNNEFGIVNDQLYDIFMTENENYLDVVDSLYSAKGRNCSTANLLRPVIAAIFVNYLHADEKAAAESVFTQYYKCNDGKKFKEALKKLQ